MTETERAAHIQIIIIAVFSLLLGILMLLGAIAMATHEGRITALEHRPLIECRTGTAVMGADGLTINLQTCRER